MSPPVVPTVPSGVEIVPRRFAFRELDAIPKYWFGGNKLITHVENTFSILIPPGERFFIQSVRHYADRIQDPTLAKLVQAFIAQEGHHTRAHHEFNRHFERFGVGIAREEMAASRLMERAARFLPKKVQLGITVFFEHLTATGAHMLFTEPGIARRIHPEALRFWRWHAVEELEHKAVAFEVLRQVGGGYWTRVFSAVVGLLWFAPGFVGIARRLMREDPEPVTDAMRADAKALDRRARAIQTPLLLAYFKQGFHPWKLDDAPYLRQWYASAEGRQGDPEVA